MRRDLTQLVLKEKVKNPYLSCRSLASRLKEKYGVSVSKTAVHTLLRDNHFLEEKGRKKEERRYQKAASRYCGLFLLKVANESLRLSESIGELLKPSSEQNPLSASEIKKYVDFCIYVSFFTPNIREIGPAIPEISLLYKVSGFSSLTFSSSKFQSVLGQFSSLTQPLASYKEFTNCFKPIGSIRLFTQDETVLYSDPQYTQLWESIPHALYFANVAATRARVQNSIHDRCISFMCVPSMFGFSSHCLQSILALKKGVARIEICDTEGVILQTFACTPGASTQFMMGFNPNTLKKSLNVTSHIRKDRMTFPGFPEELYLYDFESILLQNVMPANISCRIILLQKVSHQASYWGIMTDIGRATASAQEIARRYLSSWLFPYEIHVRHLERTEMYKRISPPAPIVFSLAPFSTLQLSSPPALRALAHILQEYCRAYLLPPAPSSPRTFETLETILSTQGYIIDGKKNLLINLIPENKDIKETLEPMLALANKENTYLGNKRLVFSLVKV